MRFPLRAATMVVATGAVAAAAATGWAAARAVVSAALVDEAARHLEQATRLGAARLRVSQGVPLDSVVR